MQPSTSSSDLKQTNSNVANSNSTAVVENTNVNVVTQNAPNVAVGDIYYQAPHAYINAYANASDWGVIAGVQVPLGGGRVRKAAAEMAKLKLANYRLSTCAAVASMSVEAVMSQAPEFVHCAGKARIARAAPDYSEELITLRIELAEMKAKLAAMRNANAPEPAPAKHHQQVPVRGLW